MPETKLRENLDPAIATVVRSEPSSGLVAMEAPNTAMGSSKAHID